jgi:hypothetical protein
MRNRLTVQTHIGEGMIDSKKIVTTPRAGLACSGILTPILDEGEGCEGEGGCSAAANSAKSKPLLFILKSVSVFRFARSHSVIGHNRRFYHKLPYFSENLNRARSRFFTVLGVQVPLTHRQITTEFGSVSQGGC